MTSRLVAGTGVLTPLYFGNPTAPQSGAEVVHNPWKDGIAGYLIQAAAASTTLSLSTGESWSPDPNSVSLLTDADASHDPALIAACGVDALFLNGSRYSETTKMNLRWIREFEEDSQPPETTRIDFSLVLHTVDPLPYRIQLVDKIAQVTVDLPSSGLRLLQLAESGQTILPLPDDVVVTVDGANDSSGGTRGGGTGDGTDTPWPPG